MSEIKKRDELLDKVKRLVKHRQRMMLRHGALCTVNKLNAASKILRKMDYVQKCDIKIVAQNILNYEYLFLEIMPGASSEFYHSDYKKLAELTLECQEVLGLLKKAS